jgi:16S rRNA G966 N2-methylase RsmD
VTGVLDQVSRAERLLARATTPEEVKEVLDLASFAADLAKRMGLSTLSVNHALLIKARAMRRLADVVDEGQARGEIAAVGRPEIIRSPDNFPAPLPVPAQRLHEARRIRDAFTDDDLRRRFAEASERGRELPTTRLLADAKHTERETSKRAREQQRAAAAPLVAQITLSGWENWLAEQDDCDLLLTDPPYSTDVPDVQRFAQGWLPVALKKVKPSGRAYVCIGAYPEELYAYLDVPAGEFTLANVLVWTYRNTLGPSPSHDYKLNWQAILYYRGPNAAPLDCPEMTEQFTVQDINAPDGRHGDRWHAWQKPDELAERFVRHASRPGDLILDPFAGTGTFLLAAARLGRSATGCDASEDSVRIATERGCRLVV